MMVDEDLARMVVSDEAAQAFLEGADRRLANAAWVNKGTTHGYYRHPSGKVVLAIPHHNSAIWRQLRRSNMEDFVLTKRPDAKPAPKREMEMLSI